MNREKWILLFLAVGLMAGTAGLLGYLSARQKLGAPGVRTEPTKDPKRLRVILPDRVLDYKSEWVEVDDLTKANLPADTSFGHRRYEAPDKFQLDLSVVMMGTDRTSLHKPQFCLEGQGCRIDQAASEETKVNIDRPSTYDLPVVKLIGTKPVTVDGREQVARVVYVYWFVADDAISASLSGAERMRMMASKLVRTGILQRWAYVACASVCAPGQEAITFERIREFIAEAVPGFQLVPHPTAAKAAATH